MNLKSEYSQSEVINLSNILNKVYSERKIVIISTVLAVVLSVIYALSLPNIYKSSTLFTSNNETSSMTSGAMRSQFGSLASLAGIQIPNSSGSDKTLIAIEMLKSKKFFSDYLYENILIELMASEGWDQGSKKLLLDNEKYDANTKEWIRNVNPPLQKKPSTQEAHNAFLRLFSLEEKDPPFYEITVLHQSPIVAMRWNKLIMQSINEALRVYDVENSSKAIEFLMREMQKNNQVVLNDVFASLIEQQTQKMMLADISEEYALRTIDPAVASEQRFSPKRRVIVILGATLGLIISLLIIFVREYRKNKFIF